jgi:hypothetical protein
MTAIPSHLSAMQNLRAEADHWYALAREKGPGWRVWRWEEWEGDRLVWRHRLLAPDEKGDGLGVVLVP